MLQRELQFRRVALMDGIHVLVAALSAFTMVRLGFGYWTLALSPLIATTVHTILVVAAHPVPFRKPQLESIREPVEFSRNTIIGRLCWFGYSNADFLVVSKMLGQEAMGAYNFGWQVAGMAGEKITALVGRVTPAFFAALQDNLSELKRYFLNITEGLAISTFPACVGIALVADDLILVIGEQWVEATTPLRLLALLAIVRSVIPLVSQVVAALGQQRMNRDNAILMLCTMPVAFVLAGGAWGINGVAAAWVTLGPLLMGRLAHRTFRRIELPWAKYFGALWPAVSGCLVMTVVVIGIDIAALEGVSPLPALIVKSLAGAVTYAAALLLLQGERIRKLRGVLATVRSRKVVANPATAAAVDVATPPTSDPRRD
jgi:PST family polysaccharide transporter